MREAYKLTPWEQDVVANNDKGDVVAAGPWQKGEATLPHRVVLRDQGDDKYVVHMQRIQDDIVCFDTGFYFRPRLGVDPLKCAWLCFSDRVARQFEWKEEACHAA
jgi:hypothetical protein